MFEDTLFIGSILIWLILILELFYCLKRFQHERTLGEKARRPYFVIAIWILGAIFFNIIPMSLALFESGETSITSLLLLISIVLTVGGLPVLAECELSAD